MTWRGFNQTSFARDERGAILVFFALAMPVFLMVLGFVIDLNLARLTGNRLQIAADAAALAAVRELKDDGDVNGLARQYSTKNYPHPGGHPILKNDDIATGHWDGTAFILDGTPTDVVRVTTRRASENNNPLASIFSVFAGIEQFDRARSAVAHAGIRPICKSGGFFTSENVESGSDNHYVADFCLFGRKGVKISSDNSFEDGSIIGMNDLDDFEQGGSNTGVDDALIEMNEELVLPAMVPGIISDMKTSTDGLPDFATWTMKSVKEITDSTPLTPGTLYVVKEVADLVSNRTISDIAIVAQ